MIRHPLPSANIPRCQHFEPAKIPLVRALHPPPSATRILLHSLTFPSAVLHSVLNGHPESHPLMPRHIPPRALRCISEIRCGKSTLSSPKDLFSIAGSEATFSHRTSIRSWPRDFRMVHRLPAPQHDAREFEFIYSLFPLSNARGYKSDAAQHPRCAVLGLRRELRRKCGRHSFLYSRAPGKLGSGTSRGFRTFQRIISEMRTGAGRRIFREREGGKSKEMGEGALVFGGDLAVKCALRYRTWGCR